ncbi:MAG: PC4/YdbC family ssDNA-binding protein [Steroidobacteraceae bacterium]
MTEHRKTDRRQAPKPALTEPIEVKKFFANRKGDIVVVAIRQMEDGPPFLDIRKFFTDENGVMRPTKKGVSVAIIRAPDLHDGVTKAVNVARQLGLLKLEAGHE